MLEVNAPDVVAEVAGAFGAYDTALLRGDLDALDRAFWSSHSTIRYGIGEELYGHDAITAYRRARAGPLVRGPLTHSVITAFGRDAATVSVEFDGGGRQTQTWIRMGDEWRVVCAHVSRRSSR